MQFRKFENCLTVNSKQYFNDVTIVIGLLFTTDASIYKVGIIMVKNNLVAHYIQSKFRLDGIYSLVFSIL